MKKKKIVRKIWTRTFRKFGYRMSDLLPIIERYCYNYQYWYEQFKYNYLIQVYLSLIDKNIIIMNGLPCIMYHLTDDE